MLQALIIFCRSTTWIILEVVVERITSSGQKRTHIIPAGSTESTFNAVHAHVDRRSGCVWFSNSSKNPTVIQEKGIENNITITASKTTPGAEKTICQMTFGTWFGSGKA